MDLYYAIGDRDLNKVIRLINHQQDPNARYRGNCALCVSIVRKTDQITKYLLDHGADPNSLDHQGNPALMIAIIYSNNEIINYLIEKGAKFNGNGRVALCYAVKNNFTDKVLILLKAGCDVNEYNYNGSTRYYK